MDTNQGKLVSKALLQAYRISSVFHCPVIWWIYCEVKPSGCYPICFGLQFRVMFHYKYSVSVPITCCPTHNHEHESYQGEKKGCSGQSIDHR